MGAVWTVWKPFFVGEYKARGFRFQLRATSTVSNHNIIIRELQVSIDMPDRVVNLTGLVSSVSTFYQVTYDAAFAETPAIGITAFNMNSGDYYQITENNKEGFRITFFNSSSAQVQRTFSVLAKGYGRQS